MVVPTYDPKSTTERKMLGSQDLSKERTRGAGVSDFGSGCKVKKGSNAGAQYKHYNWRDSISLILGKEIPNVNQNPRANLHKLLEAAS